MIKSAEGSAGLLHKIAKPTMWRGGVQILKREEEDARLLDLCEAQKKEWAKHWQCDETVENVEDKSWNNEELKKLEDALEKHLVRTKQKQEWDATDSTRKFPSRREIVEFLEKVEQWPQQGCTTMFFLIANITREADCAHSDVDTLLRSFEGS